MKTVFGNYDKSYNDLPDLMVELTHFITGTVIQYTTTDVKDRAGRIVPGVQVFDKLFWALKSTIDGFRFCKRMIQVDGTWLYGKYKHVLLIAVAQDGENNVFPIAFAIVERNARRRGISF